MNEQEILKVIADNFLCVRRLPFKVVSHYSYREGDENKKWVDADGKPSRYTHELVVQEFDLDWFKNNKPEEWDKDSTPEQRFERFIKNNPTGQRKLLRMEKTVDNGGWWFVKQVQDTGSTVRFSREYDKFFAPTLGEAVQLYLDSLN